MAAAAGLAAMLAAVGVAAWLLLAPQHAPPRPEPPATPVVPPAPITVPARVAPAAPPTPAFVVATATEAEILAHDADRLAVFRFALNPAIVVLDFPTLRQQGEMLNRVAALVEKAGQPRDRVLDDAGLAHAIATDGETVDTYYYGHDYSARDLARFFALADHDAITLSASEELLRALLRQLGWLEPGAVGALITLPRLGADSLVDADFRRTILHHELSHGEYFTVPAYAAYAAVFFRTGMDDAARDDFRRFLARQGYDIAIDDLVINETQAYLMHTRDPRAFNATALGMSESALALLQARFLLGMPPGWLRDCTPAPPTQPAAVPAAAPAVAATGPRPAQPAATAHTATPRPTRPRQRLLISIGRAPATRRWPLRMALAMADRRSRR